MPPGAIRLALLEGEGEGPLSQEGSRGVLSVDTKGFKISDHQSIGKEMIREGNSLIVIMSTNVMVRAVGEGVSMIGGTGFMDESDVVVT